MEQKTERVPKSFTVTLKISQALKDRLAQLSRATRLRKSEIILSLIGSLSNDRIITLTQKDRVLTRLREIQTQEDALSAEKRILSVALDQAKRA